MKNIFHFGCYTVGSSEPIICHDIHEVIYLSLIKKTGHLPKKGYNLDELRDLESKLVLITGSNAENRAEVDTFIDVSTLGMPQSNIILSSISYFHRLLHKQLACLAIGVHIQCRFMCG